MELKTHFKIPSGKDRPVGCQGDAFRTFKPMNSNQLGNSRDINMSLRREDEVCPYFEICTFCVLGLSIFGRF